MTAVNAYFSLLMNMLRRVQDTQGEQMETAARRIARAVKEGHPLYTFGTGEKRRRAYPFAGRMLS